MIKLYKIPVDLEFTLKGGIFLLKINDFTHKRISGDNRLQSFRDVLEYNNINLSTKICFGLGQGIFFRFLDSYPNTSIITMIGRNSDTEETLCRSLGINIICHEETNIYRAKMILINRLEKYIPTIIDVDVNALDYSDKISSTDNMHSVVVIGFDEKEDKFAIIDSVSTEPIWIESKKLEKARNSTSCVFLPKNKWYDLDFANYKNYLTLNAYCSSIKSVCLHMKSRLFDTGINGMRNLFNEFNERYDEFRGNNLDDDSKELLNLNLLYFGSQIKNSESSNSFYRSLYAEYLKRLYLFTDIEFFNEYSSKCNKISLFWKRLGDFLTSEDESLMSRIAYFINIFSEIIHMEDEFFTSLYEGLNQFIIKKEDKIE